MSTVGSRMQPSSRDFCNAFWGVGDAGVNILFARMRGAARTTDDLRNFWRERALIEEEYATRLLNLSKMMVGKDEIGELRNSVDALRSETEKVGQTHLQLASQIRSELEDSTTALFNRQVETRRNIQTPLEKRFKAKQAQEVHVAKAREKYQGDCLRINSYTQQLETNPRDADLIRKKLSRAQQTVQANEQDYAQFCKQLQEMTPEWEKDWKEFCDVCQDMEEERIEFMKDKLWTYANAVSQVCVDDDLTCESIRTVLDQLEPERDIEAFVQEYGTGNTIPNPQPFMPYSAGENPALLNGNNTRAATFGRVSKRPPSTYMGTLTPPATTTTTTSTQPPHQAEIEQRHVQRRATLKSNQPTSTTTTSGPPQQANLSNSTGPGSYHPPGYSTPSEGTNSKPPSRRSLRPDSQPLPEQPSGGTAYSMNNDPAPSPPPEERGRILFYVKALYDYQATIEEEFDFQAGDVIAVTATPDDGWWSGELLDEARREEGRHIFPSNFVTLF